MTWSAWAATQAHEIRDAGRWRAPRDLDAFGVEGTLVAAEGSGAVVSFASNDYLGLTAHPAVIADAHDALDRWGAGSGSARLIVGSRPIHSELEHELADWKGAARSALFPTGFAANLGVLTTFGTEGAIVYSDELNHASIIDGCRLARADVFVYRHCDLDHLQWALRERGRPGDLIVTDTVFSMDGDIAPLRGIVELAKRHGVRVIVDEAHATGALGPGGRGAVAAAGVEAEVDVIVGTLSKALGSYGGYVCASAEIVELLLNTARTLIFSTAPPPPAVAGAEAALDLLIEQPLRPEKLQAMADALRAELRRAGIEPPPPGTQILPLIAGDADAALRVSAAALERGVFAQAIRPPTVPDGSSRLRLTVMASHTASQLAGAAAAIAAAALETGVTLSGASPAVAEPVARAA